MAGGHVPFFVGLGAGVAILAVPVLTLTPGLDVPSRLGSWIAGTPPQPAAAAAEVVAASRPQRGFVPGAPTPVPDAPPPTLQAVVRPTSPPPPATPTPAGQPPANATGTRTGVIRLGSASATNQRAGSASGTNQRAGSNASSAAGAGSVAVRRVAGVESPNDPQLADGAPVLISSGPELDVRGQRWRAVRGLNGVAGWVLSSQVAVDGESGAAPIVVDATPSATGEHVRVANTGGIGVALRGSPRDEDRLPSGLRDGAEVMVVERSGTDWARVRSAAGQEGWVPTRYLAPAT